MLFRSGLIRAVRTAGNAYFTEVDPTARVNLLNALAAKICHLYGRSPCTVRLEISSNRSIGGCCTDAGIVIYNKLSFTTFLHEMYHWLTIGHDVCSDEAIARQWSCSLFIRALPARAGKNIVAIGNVMHVPRNRQPQRRLRRTIPATSPSTTQTPAQQPAVPAEPEPAVGEAAADGMQ